MKSLPFTNSQRLLLCDDKDYEILAPYSWRLHEGSDVKIARAYILELGVYCTPLRLIFGLYCRVFPGLFRDGDFANFQRDNLNLKLLIEKTKKRSSLPALHCLHGPATLVDSRLVGRPDICLTCSSETTDFYLQCLDIVALNTFWKGWLRYEQYERSEKEL